MKIFVLFLILLMSFLICSVSPHNLDMGILIPALAQGGHRNSDSRGEAAVGMLVKEIKDKSGKMLVLDVTPCREPNQSSMVITFRKKYKIKKLGELSCGDGRTYEGIQVIQEKLN